jgi:nucleotide-binding universal stress UspA family protein
MPSNQFVQKILVPADGSEFSVMAEETAAEIAKRTGATVTVLHSMPMLEGYQLPANVESDVLGRLEQDADKIVSSARALFAEEKVKAETETVKSHDPAESILDFSEGGFDLVVMGGRGKDEKEPFALGSVAKKVMTHAKCPVLITKKYRPLSNLLICVDGSESATRAMDFAVKLAETLESRLTLLNVQEPHFYEATKKHAKD